MTGEHETPNIPPSREELAAIELYQQLRNIGPDTDRALLLTLRLPSGRYVGDVWLSAADVTALTDGAVGISLVANAEPARAAYADDAAPPLPLAEDDLTSKDVANVIGGLEALLQSESSEDGEA